MKYLNKITTLSLFFILISGNVFSQEITARDSKTSVLLPNVYIYNEAKTKSIITNDEGQASLSNFSSDEIVYFQLLGYKLLELQLSEFLNNSFDIYLEAESQNLDEVILSVARSESKANEIAERVIKKETLRRTCQNLSCGHLNIKHIRKSEHCLVETCSCTKFIKPKFSN